MKIKAESTKNISFHFPWNDFYWKKYFSAPHVNYDIKWNNKLFTSVTRFGDLSPFWQFLDPFGDKFFAQNRQKIFFNKSFDVNIFGLEKLGYLLWRQIWRFLPKCWRLFCPNTWSLWLLETSCECRSVRVPSCQLSLHSSNWKSWRFSNELF